MFLLLSTYLECRVDPYAMLGEAILSRTMAFLVSSYIEHVLQDGVEAKLKSETVLELSDDVPAQMTAAHVTARMKTAHVTARMKAAHAGSGEGRSNRVAKNATFR